MSLENKSTEFVKRKLKEENESMNCVSNKKLKTASNEMITPNVSNLLETDISPDNNNLTKSIEKSICSEENSHSDRACCTENPLNNSRVVSSDQLTNESEDSKVPQTFFNGQDINSLSKSQMKKYKKMLSWEASKKEKRKKEKERAKQRKIEAKLNNVDLGPSRKQLKLSKMSKSPCKTSVIIDLSFDELMIPKDLGKVVKQILRVYTENRRSQTPMQLHLCSFQGSAKEEMSKHSGYENWDCNFHTEDYAQLFPHERLVYLTSESDNIITQLEQDKMYIIGGLVDHNAHKGVCHDKAVAQGISHAQLPISEFFKMKRRKVFTINQVFEILLRVCEGVTFKEAFEKVLPARINIVPTTTDPINTTV